MIIVKIQDLPKAGGSKYARVCESNDTTYLNEPGYEISFINEENEYTNYYCKGWDCPSSQSYSVTGSGNLRCGVSQGYQNPRHLLRLSYQNSLAFNTPCENYEYAYTVNQPGQKGYVIGCPNGLALYDASASISSATILPSTTSSLITSASATTSTSSSSLASYITNIASDSSSSSSSSSSSDSNLNTLSFDSLSYSSNFLEQTTSNSLLAKESHSMSDAPWPTNVPADESSRKVYISIPTPKPVLSTSQEAQQSNYVVNLSKTSSQLGVGAIVGIVFASIAGFTILTVLAGVAGFVFLNLLSKGNSGNYSFIKTTRTVKV